MLLAVSSHVGIAPCITQSPSARNLPSIRHQKKAVWGSFQRWENAEKLGRQRMFVQGGEQVALVFGPTHGPEVGDYRLYDVKTGKLLSEV